jgi:hypothetical protein
MIHKALVFLSCGQRDDEAKLAAEIEKVVKEFGLDCYNADTRHGFDDVMSITGHLSKADYYLFIDFKREVKKDGDIPISVFTHQEFALARAWGITEMLPFREKGLPDRDPGIEGYVLSHPIEFERRGLVQLVKREINDRLTKGEWRVDYSRNLVVSELTPTGEVQYTDHFGTSSDNIWHVKVENRRSDRAAPNATAILEGMTITETGERLRILDTTFLKWAYQQAYQKTILPGATGNIDVFAIRVNDEGVFLHSAWDFGNAFGRRDPIVRSRGNYCLEYLLHADSFPVVHFKVNLDYQGPATRATLQT